MIRFIRYRCIIFRYIILWLFLLTLIKITTLFYYDLQQQQSIDSSSLALPFDNEELIKEQTSTQSSSLPISFNQTTIKYYRQYVKRKNSEQFMYNKKLFSSKTTRYVLLVQVHTRVVYLKKFIEMLRSVQTINQTLLIFSHDFIDPEINILVRKIEFVPVD
jgi:hypothetical protein